MTPTRDPATIAQNVLRYLDVLASEWRTMREFLVASARSAAMISASAPVPPQRAQSTPSQ